MAPGVGLEVAARIARRARALAQHVERSSDRDGPIPSGRGPGPRRWSGRHEMAPITRMAWRVAARTVGGRCAWRAGPDAVRRFARLEMRAVIPSAQAEALTRKASDSPRDARNRPARACPRSAGRRRASGTRSSASASTMRARPSLVESAYSRSICSTPPNRLAFADAAMRLAAWRSTRRALRADGARRRRPRSRVVSA
jgi:hypothetical protein